MTQEVTSFKAVKIPDTYGCATRFLYNTVPGRIVLKLLIKTSVSQLAGLLLRCPASRVLIKRFVKQNNINMEEYREVKFKSFNDFFIREIKEEYRPLPQSGLYLAAPSDGKLTAYQISADSVYDIKHSKYSIENMLQDKELADEYSDGVCLIFRLTPDDYHRYIYIDDGDVLLQKRINGVLHTVRPIAFEHYDVFGQNTRDYTIIQTKNFGKVVQIEVGALFVGRISNHNKNRVIKRGEEKGMFEFGGSTIVMLFQKDKITVDKVIYENTDLNMETLVKMGNKIGTCHQSSSSSSSE